MFIELWKPLEIMLHENASDDSTVLCKRLINDTLVDLSNLYDWEFLKDAITYTCTASSQSIVLDNLVPFTLSAATVLYAYCTATGDSGTNLGIFGKYISGDTFTVTSENLTVVTTATATGAISWSHIDRFTRTGTAGDIIILSATGVEIFRIEHDESERSLNIAKITGVYDVADGTEVRPMDVDTMLKGNALASMVNGGTTGTGSKYFDVLGNGIATLNTDIGDILLITFQKRPRVLVQNIDTPDFPRQLWPKIIEAAALGYGYRYEDEADGAQAKLAYRAKLDEIISDWVTGRGQSTTGRSRVMPAGIRRSP